MQRYMNSPPELPPVTRRKCPVCLGAKTIADGVHALHRCRTCNARGYVVVEEIELRPVLS